MNHMLLLTFLDVLETRNFNRTAEQMNITQSTVSARIRQLEQELDTRLFERGRGGAAPTAAGRRFEPHCRSILAAWQMASRDVSAGGTHTQPRLRVATHFSLPKSVLVAWSQIMRQARSNLTFYLDLNFSQHILHDVLSGDTDIGIIFTPQSYPELNLSEICTEQYHLFSTDCDTYEDLDWSRYIKVAYTSDFEHQHDSLLPDVPQAATVVGNDDLAAHFLRSDGGAAFLPNLSVPTLEQAIPNLRRVAGAPVLSQTLYSVVHNRKRHDPLIRRGLAEFKHLLRPATDSKIN